jgi:hypothetical protein
LCTNYKKVNYFTELGPDTENVPRKIETFGTFFPKRAPKREINSLTLEELNLLFKEASRSQSKLLLPLIQFLANTGLWRSEALNLQCTDIDRESGFIYIRQSKNGKARTSPLEPIAWNSIEILKGRSRFIFVHPDGSRHHVDIFLKPLRGAAKRAGIHKRFDLHTFRHSYGSNKIRMGWGLKKVSLLLGNSDISITSSIYTHLLEGDLRVQDDFRFDNDKRNSDSAELRGLDMVSEALARILVNALKDTPDFDSSLEKIVTELDQLLKGAGIQLDSESLIKNLKDLPEMQKSDVDATPLLRSDSKSADEKLKTEMNNAERNTKFSLNYKDLALVRRIGRGDVIRTRDLFVPKPFKPNTLYPLLLLIFEEYAALTMILKQVNFPDLSQTICQIQYQIETLCPVLAPQGHVKSHH